jgi:hypothetical protein
MKQHTRFSTSLTTREGTESEIYVSESTRTVFHLLSYRLLQGSEAMLQGDATSPCFLSEEKIIAMKHRLHILDVSTTHIIGHMNVSRLCVSPCLTNGFFAFAGRRIRFEHNQGDSRTHGRYG